MKLHTAIFHTIFFFLNKRNGAFKKKAPYIVFFFQVALFQILFVEENI